VTSSSDTPLDESLPALAVEFVNVDAVQARQWLDDQSRNRNLRKSRVVEFSRDMLGNKWHPTGEAIKFDTEGLMVDGQHRCEAVILADKTRPGISVPMLVVRGVPHEAQMVMDTNTRRTAADQLRIAGFNNYAMLSAAAKWCILWDRKAMYADRMIKTVTHAEILDYVEVNRKLIEITNEVTNRLNKHIDMPSGYICAGYYICWRVDSEYAEEFYNRLADGVMLAPGDPILALRNRLRDLRKEHSSLQGEVWLSLLMRVWNMRREGRKLQTLQLYKDGQFIRCPEPK
jgi:hypothetical protein